MGGHQTRTGVLAWNSRILASGSRDRNILQHDLRVSNDCISKLVGHKSEVNALKDFFLMTYNQLNSSWSNKSNTNPSKNFNSSGLWAEMVQ